MLGLMRAFMPFFAGIKKSWMIHHDYFDVICTGPYTHMMSDSSQIPGRYEIMYNESYGW